MAIKSGFFNSINGDRRYDAKWFSEYFASFIQNGVFPTPDTALKVVANDNMSLIVRGGTGWIDGYFIKNEFDFILNLEQSDGVLNRIDRVVLRINYLIREGEIVVKKGVFSSNPIAPQLQRDADIYELALADIYVSKGTTQILQSNITDLRANEYLCGWATAKVVGWERIQREFYEWFNGVQSASYATTSELRKVSTDLKKEVANLNLELEASKRVKQGTTFGTDFVNTFGMEIDFAKSKCLTALNIGQTDILLDNASGFKVGQEITIYDDVNLERRIIFQISNNTITINQLNKEYKAGVNIARSMAIVDEIDKVLKFGFFGTLSNVTVNGEVIQNYQINSLISLDGSIFYIDSSRRLNIRKNDGDWVLSTALQGTYFQAITTDGSDYIFVTSTSSGDSYNNRNVYIHAYDKNGQFIKQTTLTTVVYATSYDLEFYNGVIYYAVKGSNNAITLSKVTFDGVDFLKPTTIANGTWGAYKLLILNENEFVYYNITSTGVNFQKIVGSAATSHTFTQSGIVWGGRLDGKLTFISINNNVIGIHQTDNNSNWNTKTYTLGSTPTKTVVVVDREETIHIAIVVGSSLYVTKKLSTGENFEELVAYGMVSVTNLAAPIAHNQKYKKPLLLVDNNKIMAELLIGDGAPILTNDIRFNVKKTQEVAAWIEHDEGLTVSEAYLNSSKMEVTTVNDETQLIGIDYDSTVENTEVRLTINRQSVEEDLKINRIIGGVS